jgi:hypothetical protein
MEIKRLVALALLAMALSSVAVCAATGLQIIYIDYANNADEIVVIFNASPLVLNLTGYRLWSQGDQEFVFGISELNPQQPVIAAYDVVRIHSGMCNPLSDPRDFRWQKADGSCYLANVWNDSGDIARLFAPGGVTPISEYHYP